MIKEQIWIGKTQEQVWSFIEMEFAKAFKCSPSKLLNSTTTTKTRTFSGHETSLKQVVSEHVPMERLVIVSQSSKDKVITGYELVSDGEKGTFVTLFEDGEGIEKKTRTWNYKLMTLPIINRGSKKRLRSRLESIKYILEGSGEEDDSSTISA